MKEKDLIDCLANYLVENPQFNENDLWDVFKKARIQATLASIPSYKPLNVLDKKEILSDFEEQQKTVKRIHYKDESTEEFE